MRDSPMTSQPPTIPAACAHEAAHAVVALVLGRQVTYATSRPSEDCAGHVMVTGMCSWSADRTDVLILLAGIVAELSAGYPIETSRYASDEDVCFARVILRSGLPRDRQWAYTDGVNQDLIAVFTESLQAVVQIVSEHWPWIEAVAHALTERVGLQG